MKMDSQDVVQALFDGQHVNWQTANTQTYKQAKWLLNSVGIKVEFLNNQFVGSMELQYKENIIWVPDRFEVKYFHTKRTN